MTRTSDRISELFLALLRTPDLPSLGPDRRPSRRPVADLERVVVEFCHTHGQAGVTRDCLRSAALLWHDHLDESHTISQGIASADGSMLHGIMHRREPDYDNAAYWFRRVGQHPCHPYLARCVQDRLVGSTEEQALAATLAPGGKWDPFALIAACARAIEDTDPTPRTKLQEIQQLEFECLIRSLLADR